MQIDKDTTNVTTGTGSCRGRRRRRLASGFVFSRNSWQPAPKCGCLQMNPSISGGLVVRRQFTRTALAVDAVLGCTVLDVEDDERAVYAG